MDHQDQHGRSADSTAATRSRHRVDTQSRAVLPIPDVRKSEFTAYDAKDPDTKYPPIRELRPPKGAPNVLVILLDDVGFADFGCYGSEN